MVAPKTSGNLWIEVPQRVLGKRPSVHPSKGNQKSSIYTHEMEEGPRPPSVLRSRRGNTIKGGSKKVGNGRWNIERNVRKKQTSHRSGELQGRVHLEIKGLGGAG